MQLSVATGCGMSGRLLIIKKKTATLLAATFGARGILIRANYKMFEIDDAGGNADEGQSCKKNSRAHHANHYIGPLVFFAPSFWFEPLTHPREFRKFIVDAFKYPEISHG